ncbi:uncharacterized protein LOC107272408 isoform X4 [Cephus cinctus]|uniref:Uncharacterized protein LOC107272408 isoform X4 n=1 Tax=Cephus cinctus TaxID=211228 RepID=A0AAJ7C942_CEPCN|nr:uncharacterized protein LOC107272408 isoform X4 [Cephus cinctus]
MNPTAVRQWLQRGELEKLENVVVEGRGARLLGEHSPDLRTRVFLKGLPNYLTKIAQIHDAVIRGSLSEIQRIISEEPKKKLAIAKDPSGTPLIHKAVYYDHQNIIEWLVKNYPVTTQQKDKEGRIALHYCAACRDPSAVWDVLIEAGCDASICDKRGNPSAYYLKNTSEIELPEAESMAHRKASSGREKDLDFKPSNIRIWIHNRDIGKLQQVLWEGHGSKLRCETSNNPRVKKFLEAVPFIMGTIKSVHTATVKNDLEAFRDKIADPVSPVILCSKDSNGLNVLHKAAGLGYLEIAREILERYPAAVLAQDSEGKTPLHYAAAVKDSGVMYDLLVGYGADESKLDNRQKAPAFYKNRPSDVDVTNLVVIPEAPRVSGTNYPKNWDWRILEAEEGLRGTKKVFNNVDLDSAFGTAEAATKVMNGAKKILANDHKEDPKDDLVERIKLADAELEKKRAALSEKAEAKEEPEAEQEKDVTEEEDEEGKSSDDDVVVTTSEITEGNTENNNTNVEVNADDYSTSENLLGEQTNPENKEKSDPSTGDSGVDDPGNEEDQVIVGEHEELPEAELNEGSMAVDPEVEDLVENGNMEQLAALVLNGEGRRLVGRHSSNPELQAFIDNVPAYMGKIHAVHIAAREGDLRDLQSALDRRKFAIARDASSPHGATPLHAAVIFGHTSIIRYLAGRFPETAHAIDLDGRTPLHYAATLADNGHYYNLLLHLGANPLVQDNFEQKAEFYKHNQKDLSHKKLLRDFGARENIADEMLTDKVPGEDVYSARRDVTEPETLATLERCYRLLAGARRDDTQVDIPIFHTEEGRYLASSLGDPLIKGLTEVANTRPKDPVTYLATYLYNFASKNKSGGSTQANGDNPENDNPDDDAGYPQSPDSDSPESAFSSSNRDEHGQSIIHFAAVRSHAKDALFQLLQETQVNVGYRDELYRTARDVAEQANISENVEEIDRWVVYLAARGETEKLVELLLEGYDHILDAADDGVNIVEVASQRDHESTVQFLQSIPNYVTRREAVHRSIRFGDTKSTMELFSTNGSGGKLLAVGKNVVGRCSLHIAVLGQHIDIAQYIVQMYPETLRIGDNLERTALHYAMGVTSVEILSNILIKAGAKRVLKDLKARQPTYYFMNKSEIQKLQDEEESMMN